ncbi:hypothetical protein QCA50_001086 [Cerrena zonata]|uniref:Cytochrome b561 domain-containing protein n=1 Tax=Cerrena zonata TaxID=2478898 RepID=A0AAW0H0T1_9APHY
MSSMPSDPLPPPQTQINGHGEEEPLLGHRPPPPISDDEAVCHTLFRNLYTSTALLAQIGGLAFVIVVWVANLKQPLMLFTAHPLLNAIGVLLLLESTLLLQPTHTPKQKHTGAIVHSILNGTAFILMYSAFVVIFVNKLNHHGAHFESAHAIIGLTTYILMFLQATVGIVQFYLPNVVGGEANAKAIYKYHRISGYLILLFILATAISVTYTPYIAYVLKIRTWFVALCSVVILAGVLPRVSLKKLW